MLYDIRIIENLQMVKDGDPVEVKRTVKERLFTRPWRPFKRTRTVVPKVPRDDAIKLPNGTLVMHPETARKLRKMMEVRFTGEPVYSVGRLL